MSDQRDYKIKKYRYKLMMARDQTSAAIYQQKLNQYAGQSGGATDEEVAAARERLGKLKGTESTVGDDIKATNAAVASYKANVTQLVQVVTVLKQQLAESKNSVAEKEKSIAELTSQLERVRGDLVALVESSGTANAKSATRIAELEGQQATLQSEKDTLQDDLKTARADVARLTQELATAQQTISEHEATIDTQKGTIDGLNTELLASIEVAEKLAADRNVATKGLQSIATDLGDIPGLAEALTGIDGIVPA